MQQISVIDQKGRQFAYQLRQLGWQGQLAILLFLASIVLCSLIYLNVQQTNKLASVVDQLRLNTPVNLQNASENKNITQRFYDVLPAESESNQKIYQLLDLVEQHGFTLNRSDYSTREVPQSSMMLYQIKFPLVGRYPNIRHFVTDVMNELPSIALSHLSFQRDDVKQDEVSANIEFFLYTKSSE
ncbi:hypothetical protein LCGC14_0536650 [marine sediment metagenome]|uniref:Pilus assembly protein, PilO n=1 Tax=marine sediment metagenome TaxID=412755 RepID=A0A0F9UFH0_9ZZZZ|nr:hypothetical protein [Methylophaga sp.]HEC58578.1 hypothetical protein [Methylophaga sp.]